MKIILNKKEREIIVACLEFFSRQWEDDNISTFDLQWLENKTELNEKDFYEKTQKILKILLTNSQ